MLFDVDLNLGEFRVRVIDLVEGGEVRDIGAVKMCQGLVLFKEVAFAVTSILSSP